MDFINLIEIASIIIGAILGVLGSITETKKKSGHLTKWGKIAVGGIIVANSFSLINAYLKQKKDANNEILAIRKENLKLAFQDSITKKQIKLQDSILRISNSLQNSQFVLQKKSNDLISKLHSSINIENKIQLASDSINRSVSKNLVTQNELLSTTEGINAQSEDIVKKQIDLLSEQNKINDNISRSLNPILPFAVKYYLILKLHPEKDAIKLKNIKQIGIATNYLNTIIDDKIIKTRKSREKKMDILWNKMMKEMPYKDISESKYFPEYYSMKTIMGLEIIGNSGKDTLYHITEKYPYYKYFKFLSSCGAQIDITTKHSYLQNLSSKSNNPLIVNREFSAFASPIFKPLRFNQHVRINWDSTGPESEGIDIYYNKAKGEYYVTFYVPKVEVLDDKGQLKSINDLKGAHIGININFLPCYTELGEFQFLFPPNFSRPLQMNISNLHRRNLDVISTSLNSITLEDSLQFE